MFFIGRMNVPVFFVPYFGQHLRKVGVGLRSLGVYLRQAEAVGQR